MCIVVAHIFSGVNSARSAIGAMICSYIADKCSRKWTIQIGATILIIGAALCGGSVNVAMFLVARVITGLGIGLLVTVIPM
jgi:MFS family permease